MLRKIKDVGLTQRKVNPGKVAKALKATSVTKINKFGSPASLFAARWHVLAGLKKSAASAYTAAVYTCPMHPEVRQAEPGNCPICGMALEPRVGSLEEEKNPD